MEVENDSPVKKWQSKR